MQRRITLVDLIANVNGDGLFENLGGEFNTWHKVMQKSLVVFVFSVLITTLKPVRI